MTTPPKRGALAGMVAPKPTDPAAEPSPDAPALKPHPAHKDGRRGYTLRLDALVLKDLAQIALNEDKQVRDLMVEAVNYLLEKRGMRPNAS